MGFTDVIKAIPGLTHYYALDGDNRARDLVGNVDGIVHGNVAFGENGATFDGSSWIELPDHDDFSAAGTASKALTIIAFQTVTDWRRQSNNNEYVHWMGKGRAGAHEWTFRYYIDGGGGEAVTRPRRTSFYYFNPSGGLGTGSYFQDPDDAGVERVIGGMVWGNSSNKGSTQMWKNGAVRDTDLLSSYSVNPENTKSPVGLGSRGDNTGFLVGRLRRVAFFNRRLTDAEMKAIYDARDLPETDPVVDPPKPPPTEYGDVVIGSASYPISAIDANRDADALVVYTPAYGAASNANEWGAEASVVGSAGTVAEVTDQRTAPVGARNLAIPEDGVVLSGHGAARSWLLEHAVVDATVTLPDGLLPEEPEVPPKPELPDLTPEIDALRAKAAELRVLADDLDGVADDIEAKVSQ